MSSGLEALKGKWVVDDEGLIGCVIGPAVIDDSDYLLVDWSNDIVTCLSDIIGTTFYPTHLAAKLAAENSEAVA